MVSILNKLRTEYSTEYFPKKYTKPRIYHGGKGYDLSKRWYVYYSYLNPATGEMERQPPIYRNINKDFKTKLKRLKHLQELRDDTEELLKNGFSPYEDEEHAERYTAKSALEFALSIKKETLGGTSYEDYESRLSTFTNYLKQKGLLQGDIKEINRKHLQQRFNL